MWRFGTLKTCRWWLGSEPTCARRRRVAPRQEIGGPMSSIKNSFLGLVVHGRRLLAWWADELMALVPPRIRRVLDAEPRRVTIAVTGTDLEVHIGNRAARRLAPDRQHRVGGASDTFDNLLRDEKRRWGWLLTIALRVPVSACLVRDKDLPRQALAHAEELLLLDLEQATPFRLKDVYWGWYRMHRRPSDLAVRQVILKRSRIDPVLERLAHIGVRPVAIEVEAASGELLPVNLWPSGRRFSALEAQLRRGLAAGAVTLVLVALVVVGVSAHRHEQALATIGVETEVLRKQATDVRRQLTSVETALSQARRVRLRKAETIPVVQQWEELTRLLPETVWLTDLRLEGGTIAIDGFAQSASELVGMLAQSDHFRDVALASPVTRDPQRAFERFQIRAGLGRAGAPRAANTEPTP